MKQRSFSYGAGVLFYEGLTGALPFTGSADDVVRRKGSLPAPPPAFVVPSVPDDLDRLVTAMLERDPTRRPDAPRCLLALGMQVSSMGDRDPR